jgi:hypothetical protein
MRTRISLLLLAGLMLSACESGPKARYEPLPPPPPPPPPNEFAWSAKLGHNAIEGLGVWRDGARRFSCAGKSVLLMPETPYTKERMVELYGSDVQATRSVGEVRAHTTPAKRDIQAYVHPTQCDSLGAFSYRDLPDGGWFLIVRAASPSGDEVVALRRVHVSGGETSAVRIGV